MDLTDLFVKQVQLFDYILPTLPSSEQLIFSQIFARTILVGETKCNISYLQLSELTRQSVLTVKRAIKSLLNHGLIREVSPPRARIPTTYEIILPKEIKSTQKYHRDPILLLKQTGLDKAQYQGILERLTDEDKDLLNIIRISLTSDEETRLRHFALSSLKEGEDPEIKFKEVIVLTKFGPQRLSRYAISKDDI